MFDIKEYVYNIFYNLSVGKKKVPSFNVCFKPKKNELNEQTIQ